MYSFPRVRRALPQLRKTAASHGPTCGPSVRRQGKVHHALEADSTAMTGSALQLSSVSARTMARLQAPGRSRAVMSVEKFTFYAACERGHRPAYTWDREELRGRLDSGVIPLRCGICGAFREATPTEIAHLRVLLSESERGRGHQAEQFGEAERVKFSLTCPAGHTPTYTLNARLLRSALASGNLSLYCSKCGRFIEVGPSEVVRLRLLLDDQPRGGQSGTT